MRKSATRVTYRYRDASNYKYWGTFDLEGELDVQGLRKWMIDEEFFVPDRIGLKNLIPNPRNEDDHELHSIEETEFCETSDAFCTADEFVRRMKSVSEKGWFVDDGSWFFGRK
jgi:hypothetical protein